MPFAARKHKKEKQTQEKSMVARGFLIIVSLTDYLFTILKALAKRP